MFTLHKEANKPMPKELFDEIEVKLSTNEKHELSNLLDRKFGINESSLLPRQEIYGEIEAQCRSIKDGYSTK